jgi:hypothetical protein
MSRKGKIAIVVLTAGVALVVMLVVYGEHWFLRWVDDPGK